MPFVLSLHPTPVLALNFIAYQYCLLGCSINPFTLHHTSEILILFAQRNIQLQSSMPVHPTQTVQRLIWMQLLAQPLHHLAALLAGKLSKGTQKKCLMRNGLPFKWGQGRLCVVGRGAREQMCAAGAPSGASSSGGISCW